MSGDKSLSATSLPRVKVCIRALLGQGKAETRQSTGHITVLMEQTERQGERQEAKQGIMVRNAKGTGKCMMDDG